MTRTRNAVDAVRLNRTLASGNGATTARRAALLDCLYGVDLDRIEREMAELKAYADEAGESDAH